MAAAAHAGARGITALGHEAADDAVEHQAVIEALAGQFLDPRDVLGRQVRAQFDHHAAVRGVHVKGVFRVHGFGVVHRTDPQDKSERGEKGQQTLHGKRLPWISW